MPTVYLSEEADWDGFRAQAREQLRLDTAPDALQWRVRGGEAGLFDDERVAGVGRQGAGANASSVCASVSGTGNGNGKGTGSGTSIGASTGTGTGAGSDNVTNATSPANATPTVSQAFMTLAESVIRHTDPSRFDLIYRLLWRMQHEPGLRRDPLDADMMQAQSMARVVHRDMHKMKAFVRFRPIERDGQDLLYVAWFEPEHHIVAATAPFFRDRYTAMHWAILTPRQCVSWDGRSLTFSAGASRDDAPAADAGEALWLTYYTHIFNPARLKMNMMRKEMPRKYWHNLPEAKLISQLAGASTSRMAQMIEAPATTPARRIVPIATAADRAARTSASGLAAPPALTVGATGDETACARHADEGGAFGLGALPDRAQAMRQVQACRDCAIGQHATQAVWGEGPEQARLMVVGEQPGDQEDLRGRPFVGPAGKLFDRAVSELGWTRSELYVTNAVKHFKFEPRGKRRIHKTPAQQEAAACSQWLGLELAQVRPQAIIALGATAARALLGRAVAVTQFRGQWVDSPNGTPVLVTLHPSALLRMDPAVQADAWQAWLRDLSQASALAVAEG